MDIRTATTVIHACRNWTIFPGQRAPGALHRRHGWFARVHRRRLAATRGVVVPDGGRGAVELRHLERAAEQLCHRARRLRRRRHGHPAKPARGAGFSRLRRGVRAPGDARADAGAGRAAAARRRHRAHRLVPQRRRAVVHHGADVTGISLLLYHRDLARAPMDREGAAARDHGPPHRGGLGHLDRHLRNNLAGVRFRRARLPLGLHDRRRRDPARRPGLLARLPALPPTRRAAPPHRAARALLAVLRADLSVGGAAPDLRRLRRFPDGREVRLRCGRDHGFCY